MHLSLRENALKAKNHATAVLGETLGTAMFLFIVCLYPTSYVGTFCALTLMYNRLTCSIIGRRRCKDSQSC
jgi:predicted membrane protein